MSAEDQFDMLFGGGNPVADEKGGAMDANELLEMMHSGNTKANDDEVIEDDAIVVEFEDTEAKNNQPSKTSSAFIDGT